MIKRIFCLIKMIEIFVLLSFLLVIAFLVIVLFFLSGILLGECDNWLNIDYSYPGDLFRSFYSEVIKGESNNCRRTYHTNRKKR